jgi:tRNA(adenine34) deaminase
MSETQHTLGDDERFMRLALDEARSAAALGEVPIGAVVVCDREVVARGSNRREIDADPTAHAEMIAVRQAASVLRCWRLEGCTVYVTLEPCPMCAGALHAARVDRCVYGAVDPKAGALGTLYDIASDERLNHRYEVTAGVLADESAALLREFFAGVRARGRAPEPLEG